MDRYLSRLAFSRKSLGHVHRRAHYSRFGVRVPHPLFGSTPQGLASLLQTVDLMDHSRDDFVTCFTVFGAFQIGLLYFDRTLGWGFNSSNENCFFPSRYLRGVS